MLINSIYQYLFYFKYPQIVSHDLQFIFDSRHIIDITYILKSCFFTRFDAIRPIHDYHLNSSHFLSITK